jgi:hypothetical protein
VSSMTVTLRPKRNIRSTTGNIDDSADNSTYRTHAAICLTVRQGSRQNRCCISVFEAAKHRRGSRALRSPTSTDHARVVVAVGKIMIQRGEAVLLAGLLHIIFISSS